MVNYTKNREEFDALMETSKTKLVVIDFTATWCGPCKMIGPYFEKLAVEYPDIEFVKVDVDDANDVAAFCNISAMPTFHFYKNGIKIDDLQGADKTKLKDKVEQNK